MSRSVRSRRPRILGSRVAEYAAATRPNFRPLTQLIDLPEADTVIEAFWFSPCTLWLKQKDVILACLAKGRPKPMK